MNGTMLSTVDGGTNWKLASISRLHPFFFLDAVTFISPEIGWVVGLDLRSLGMDGLILHTENGGKTWQRQESHTANFLDDVFFISETEGWIVGKGGACPAHKGWRAKLETPADRDPNGFEGYLHKQQKQRMGGWSKRNNSQI